jgi:undecaprenyl-diphosphatase
MLDHLIHFVGRSGHWGYLLIFLGAMLESAAFLGLLIPGEGLVLVAGFFAAQGLLDLDVLIVIVGIGAALGDSLGYELGRRLGRPALERYGNRLGLNSVRIEKAETFFKRHGGKAVFLGRFVGFARVLVPFLAGSSKMPYRQFIPYNVLGAALWASAVVLLGYFLGASWQRAEHWIGRASSIVGGIADQSLASPLRATDYVYPGPFVTSRLFWSTNDGRRTHVDWLQLAFRGDF